MELNVREAEPADLPAWIAMRRKLWPDEEPDSLALEARTMRDWDMTCVPFVAEGPTGSLAGFIEVGVRSFAEGCPTGRCAYIEGIWVEPEFRKSGVGRLLLKAAETWATDMGITYIGSDALLANTTSHAWHRAVGFAEVAKLVAYAKRIG